MELKTIGDRIMYCRGLLGISRNELAIKLNITLKTIYRWENNENINTIKDKNLDFLLDIFNDYGLIVTKEWLISGNGISPINEKINKLNHYNFDEISFMILSIAQRLIEGFKIIQVNTNFFDPIVQFGDYVGIVLEENGGILNNKLCVIIQDNQVMLGIFDYNNLTLNNLQNNVIKLRKPLKIFRLMWITRRF